MQEDHTDLMAVLKNVPKLGDKKIALLLDRFGSLQNIATASLEEMTHLLGASSANHVWDYFNK